jgi:CBS domain containing-hemolysin-like protein
MIFDAFCSGAESGVLNADPLKLQHQAERGDKRSKQILKLKQNMETLIGVVMIGTNVVVVTASMLSNKLLEHWFEPSLASVITVLALTPVMLVASEILPKIIFLSRPEELSRKIVPGLRVLLFVFKPLLFVFNGLSAMLAFLLGGSRKIRPSLTREDISLLAEVGSREGSISPRSYALFGSVLSFGSTTAREIMTPLVDVTAVEEDTSVEDLVRVIVRTGFSRIPIYKERVFSMCGYVSAFDLKKSRRNESIAEYIRPAVYVPESKNVDSLLVEMRQKRLSLVFVVDEWGGTAGIITHEDIAEHVVGQIKDKGEKTELEMQQVGVGEYLADGWTDVDKVQQVLRIYIDKKGFETVGGFLEHIMQRVPQADESITYQGYHFYIEEADATRVIRVRIRQKKKQQSGAQKKKPAPAQNGKKNGNTNTNT